MSYILQALKKSQQDRELGQVPTLSTSADGTAPMPTRSINPWSFGALILALTAVLIALYGTFGDRLHHGGAQSPSYSGFSPGLESDSELRTTDTDVPGPDGASKSVVSPSLPPPHPEFQTPDANTGRQPGGPSLAEGSNGLPPGTYDQNPRKQGQPDRRNEPKVRKIAQVAQVQPPGVTATSSTEKTVQPSGRSPTATPRRSPPSETGHPRLPDTAMTAERPEAPPAGAPGIQESPNDGLGYTGYSEFLRAEARRLRERLAKLDSPPARTPIEAEDRPTPPEQVIPPPSVPERAAPRVQKPGPITAPGPGRPSGEEQTRSETSDPRPRPPLEQSLPREVHRALPERQIIAHIYAKEPERRFIIVNSTKLREGEQTADGLILQEVRPDGMVFQFRNHQFFHPR